MDTTLISKVQAVTVNYEVTEIVCPEDFEMLINKVDIVFHALASVKFNDPLYDAVNVNILNTQKIVKLVKDIQNLKSFVYVSTLFSNCNRNKADEIIYDHPIKYQKLIAIADVMKSIEKDTTVSFQFHHDFPNTYTLTKHFAEKLVVDQAKQLPTGIFRPPVVMSSYANVPGWVDNVNGYNGSIVIYAKGLSHCYIGCQDNMSNSAPVDFCINALIAAAWDVSTIYKHSKESFSEFSIPIYNYIFKENNITFKKIIELIPMGFHSPLKNSIYYYSVINTNYHFVFWTLQFLLTKVPAYVLDFLALLSGRQKKYVRMSKKLYNFFNATNHFGITKYDCKSDNVFELLKKVKKSGSYSKNLDFDLRNVDWKIFYTNLIPGIKQYYFKEDMSEVPSLVKRYQRYFKFS